MLEIFSSCHKTIGSTNKEFQEPLSGGYLYVVCVCVCGCVNVFRIYMGTKQPIGPLCDQSF